jgi:lipoate-protein ligase A
MAVIPSGVEEPLDASEGARDASTSLDMTTWLFASLLVYHDDLSHSAAMNMAVDEALLEHAAVPSIRFYRWPSPALSFGYFGKFADVADYAPERDLVRRWTGGGIVFHGNDLTYSIVIPMSDAAFSESSISIYKKIHHALAHALIADGTSAELASVAAVSDSRNQIGSAIGDRRYSKAGVNQGRYDGHCFANPVRADVMIDGRKVAGAAQRRTRSGLLQQGSIQRVDLGNGLALRFARALSNNCSERKINDEVLNRARELAHGKYGADFWLRKR